MEALTKMDAIMGVEREETGDFIVNEKDKIVNLTAEGVSKVERFFQIENLADPENLEIQHNINLALRAHNLMFRDQDYVVKDEQVLIVDEPTAGLDPEERVRFRNLLCEMAQDRIVILSTHIVGDIEATCEDIAVLDAGSMIYRGTVADLIAGTQGKVYSAQISRSELEILKKEYIVTSMLSLGNNVVARFLAEEKPFASATPCEAGAEDAYMYLMYTERGERGCLDSCL